MKIKFKLKHKGRINIVSIVILEEGYVLPGFFTQCLNKHEQFYNTIIRFVHLQTYILTVFFVKKPVEILSMTYIYYK